MENADKRSIWVVRGILFRMLVKIERGKKPWTSMMKEVRLMAAQASGILHDAIGEWSDDEKASTIRQVGTASDKVARPPAGREDSQL